jgi:hypothetical protein
LKPIKDRSQRLPVNRTKTLKPYQGLKPLSDSGYFPSKSSSKGTKTLKPYQGLKQHFVINVIVGRAWHKNPKTYQGFKTLDIRLQEWLLKSLTPVSING